MDIKQLFTWASVALQLFAALLWFYATVVRVSAAQIAEDHEKEHGWMPAQIVDSEDGSDLMATLERQTYWNKWAALVTGAGVATMAIATALPVG